MGNCYGRKRSLKIRFFSTFSSQSVEPILLMIKYWYFRGEIHSKATLKISLFSLVVQAYECIICWKIKHLGLRGQQLVDNCCVNLTFTFANTVCIMNVHFLAAQGRDTRVGMWTGGEADWGLLWQRIRQFHPLPQKHSAELSALCNLNAIIVVNVEIYNHSASENNIYIHL